MEHQCPPEHTAFSQARERLKRIEGQVRGLIRMVDDGKYCIDIITQISAARAALNNTALLILRKHLETCLTQAVREGGPKQDAIIDEMMVLLSRQEV